MVFDRLILSGFMVSQPTAVSFLLGFYSQYIIVVHCVIFLHN